MDFCRSATLPVRRECIVRDRLPDHAPVGSLPGGDLVGKKHGAHGAGKTDLTWQPEGAACVRHEADAREGLQEAGAFGGDDHVGGKC